MEKGDFLKFYFLSSPKLFLFFHQSALQALLLDLAAIADRLAIHDVLVR